jgi:hypothetical protein
VNKPEPKREPSKAKTPWTRTDFMSDLKRVIRPLDEKPKKRRGKK